MTTKAKAPAAESQNDEGQAQDQDYAVHFPPIGDEGDSVREGAAAPEQDEGQAHEDDSVEARLARMEEQFSRERETYAERERRQQETIDRLIQGQMVGAYQPQQEQQQPSDPYDMSDLPDPVDKPTEFKAALAEKMRKAAEVARQSNEQQSSQSSGMDALWSRFQSEYSDLASRPALVHGAVSLEAQELRARGIDPQRAAMMDPDTFLRNVAARMQKELGVEQQTDEGAGHKPTRSNAGRTAGVGGGSHQTRPKGGAPKAKGFMEQMKDFQMGDGLI
jgi:hypothetical protein